MLIKFTLLTINICFCLFDFSLVSPIDPKTIIYQFLQIQMTSEWFPIILLTTSIVTSQFVVFAYSFLGTYLTDQCEQIGHLAYQLHWNGKTLRSQRAIAFIILYSQGGKSITSGKFNRVSLENYCDILNTSFSYFTLLQSVFQ
jgi:hypothetical protein